jgi:2-polyprenyl-6-methoxyphenol hydroxylase-like FAD-dependent oxidoreductase
MRVTVIGGGIAGCAVALGLHGAGVDVTVHEAHPDTGADLGAFLTPASNGMVALGSLGAADPVAATGWPLARMRVLDAAGTELAAVPLGDDPSPLARYRCLRRAELVAVLQAEVGRRGIPLHHNHRLIEADGTDEGAASRSGTRCLRPAMCTGSPGSRDPN